MNKSEFNKCIRKSIEKFMDNKKEDSRVWLNCNEEHAKAVIDIFLDALVSGLEEQDEISILNYFRIFKQSRAARTGRNPKTGEPMPIAAYTNVAFKAGMKLKEACNPKPKQPIKKAKKKSIL
jgi:nucleoid DNA-binding protein